MVCWDNRAGGSGPTFLLIHGLFDSKACWRSLCSQLHPRYRVVVPDLVGFGDSSKPLLQEQPEEWRYSVSMFAHHLQSLIRELDLHRLVLVGNSLGGAIALEVLSAAGRCRARIGGLVLIAAAGYPQPLPGNIRQLAGPVGPLLRRKPIRHLLGRAGITQYFIERTFARTFHKTSRIPPESVAESHVDATPNMDMLRSTGEAG